MTDQPTLQPIGAIDVEAELQAPEAKVQLVNYRFFEPAYGILQGNGKFRIDLCLNARHRTARGCFREQWQPHRYEHIGDLFVVHPDADLIARSDEEDDLQSIVCEFEADAILEMFDTIPEPRDSLLTASLDVQNEKIRSLLLWLVEEARQPGFASDLRVELMVSQLKVELLRQGAVVSDEKARGGLASWQLRAIEERLNDAPAAPSLTELAELCRLSVRQLTRGFRASRGFSVGAYVSMRQMEHAKRLLAADESVAEIARQLGFSSTSSFCVAFRRNIGMTPGQYRDRIVSH